MWRWALQSLLAQRGWLAGAAGGVALAFVLVITFDAVWRGESEQIVAYIDETDADVWVMQRGVSNMHMASSFVWDWKADRIAELPGVERATPILYVNTAVGAGDVRSFNYVIGLPRDGARAGPWKLSAGRHLRARGEAVIPDVMARLGGATIGGRASIADRTFEIVGLSADTYSSANPITFVRMEDLADILSSTGSYSYVLVDAADGVDPAALARRIMREVENVNAMTAAAFRESDFGMAEQMGVDIIFVMTLICLALAVLIVGFTAYTFVLRRRREIAVVKALGASEPALIAAVVAQAVTVTLLGFLVAVVIALLALPRAPLLLPQLTLAISPLALARAGLVALVVAFVGALLPARRVTRLDPATAFQG